MMSMPKRQQTTRKFKTDLIDLYSSNRTIISPRHQKLIEVHSDAGISRTTGTVEKTPAFKRKTCLLVSPAVVDLDDGKQWLRSPTPTNTCTRSRQISTWRTSAYQHLTKPQTSRRCHSNTWRWSQSTPTTQQLWPLTFCESWDTVYKIVPDARNIKRARKFQQHQKTNFWWDCGSESTEEAWSSPLLRRRTSQIPT